MGAQKRTVQLYRREVSLFFEYLEFMRLPLPSSYPLLDQRVADYINHLFQEGESISKAGWLLSGLRRFYPRVRKELCLAQQWYTNWAREHTPWEGHSYAVESPTGSGGIVLAWAVVPSGALSASGIRFLSPYSGGASPACFWYWGFTPSKFNCHSAASDKDIQTASTSSHARAYSSGGPDSLCLERTFWCLAVAMVPHSFSYIVYLPVRFLFSHSSFFCPLLLAQRRSNPLLCGLEVPWLRHGAGPLERSTHLQIIFGWCSCDAGECYPSGCVRDFVATVSSPSFNGSLRKMTKSGAVVPVLFFRLLKDG